MFYKSGEVISDQFGPLDVFFVGKIAKTGRVTEDWGPLNGDFLCVFKKLFLVVEICILWQVELCRKSSDLGEQIPSMNQGDIANIEAKLKAASSKRLDR